jgi:hypothetical protein
MPDLGSRPWLHTSGNSRWSWPASYARAVKARGLGDGDPAGAAMLAGLLRGVLIGYQLVGQEQPPTPILEREARTLVREVDLAWRAVPSRPRDG